jgi:hypothetical protein
MHTLETTPEVHERGLQLLDEYLPWLRESTGFRGMLRLTAPDRSRTIMITFWADVAALAASAEAARAVSTDAADAAGSKHLDLEEYEITFFDAEFTPEDVPQP